MAEVSEIWTLCSRKTSVGRYNGPPKSSENDSAEKSHTAKLIDDKVIESYQPHACLLTKSHDTGHNIGELPSNDHEHRK